MDVGSSLEEQSDLQRCFVVVVGPRMMQLSGRDAYLSHNDGTVS